MRYLCPWTRVRRPRWALSGGLELGENVGDGGVRRVISERGEQPPAIEALAFIGDHRDLSLSTGPRWQHKKSRGQAVRVDTLKAPCLERCPHRGRCRLGVAGKTGIAAGAGTRRGILAICEHGRADRADQASDAQPIRGSASARIATIAARIADHGSTRSVKRQRM